VTAELRAAGVTVIERPDHGDTATELQRLTDADGTVLTEDAHAGCPGHATYVTTMSGYVTPSAELPTHDDAGTLDDPNDIDPDEAEGTGTESRPVWRSWIGARYVCTDPAKHGHRDRWSGSDSGTDHKKVAGMDDDEREAARAQRRDVIESNKAWASAETVRRTWLRGLLTRKTAPKGTGPFLAAALAHDASMVTGVGGNQLAAELLGCTATGGYGRSTAQAELVEQASEARALLLALAQALAGYEESTDRSDWRTERAHTARYLRFLRSCGYNPGLSRATYS
jgi:ParB family chromosome partitioning protein